MLLKTEGFVLKSRKYKETDSLLTIFGRKTGKVSAIAKGARKPKSNLLAGVQPFCYSDFLLHKGKSLYTVNQSDPKQTFYTLREDLEKLTYGSYLLELVEAVTTEGQTNNRLFNLLGQTLYLLTQEDIELHTVVRAFELKLLDYSGYKPHLYSCVGCGSGSSYNWEFSVDEGGLLCSECNHQDRFSMKVSKTSIKLANYLLKKDMKEIKNLKISGFLNKELEKVLKNYILVHINKYEFKSLHLVSKL